MSEDKSRLRDAATIILAREGLEGPEVLMGQRGAAAAFMPNKFVFPGGAVDAGDLAVPLARPLNPRCTDLLNLWPQDTTLPGLTADALAIAAIRELWEETGLTLAQQTPWDQAAPGDWDRLAQRGLMPDAAGLQFVFRAITPPGRPRRFDARFFLADVSAIHGDPDDFTDAEDELAHLQWIPIRRARTFDLPFITEVVIAEIGRRFAGEGREEGVPFFDNSGAASCFRRIR